MREEILLFMQSRSWQIQVQIFDDSNGSRSTVQGNTKFLFCLFVCLSVCLANTKSVRHIDSANNSLELA